MKKLFFSALLLLFLACLPRTVLCAPYSPEYIFNHNAVEEGVMMQYGAFLKGDIANGIKDLLGYQRMCLEGLITYVTGGDISKEAAIEAYQQFLIAEIMINSIKVKYDIRPEKKRNKGEKGISEISI